MSNERKANWTVDTSTVDKDLRKLPERIQILAAMLFKEIELQGPIRKNWHNFSELKKKKKKIPENALHCHLKKGNPTYVACWTADKKQKYVKVFYVGTHENTPY